MLWYGESAMWYAGCYVVEGVVVWRRLQEEGVMV